MKIKINNIYLTLVLFLVLIILYVILYKIYIPRVNAFGCFDDCNNFMGGYFLLHGKRLFSEIFFNHNPFMAYISYLIQLMFHPQNLYELILRHRQALLLFGFVFNLFLIFRFGTAVLAFTIFYELTKFYLFGDRFLAEGFIVYPLIYLVGLGFYKIKNIQITKFDYIFSAVCVWFVVFMREPYVPAALLLFVFLLWNKNSFNKSITSFVVFIILSMVTFFLHDINEFFFNVVTANVGLATTENANAMISLSKAFLYSIDLFFGGEWGHFRYIIVSLNILFIFSTIFLSIKKQWKIVLFSFLILGLLNLRPVIPGKVFYGSFHMLCWYGVFVFISFTYFSYIYKFSKKIALTLSLLYFVILLYHIISPSSFLQSKPDPHRELLVNYGVPMQVGMVVNSLSKSSDILFVDGFDDIIYWQAQRYSTYKYSWYTSLMPNHRKYTDERISMFSKSPPDFYYGSCPKEQNPNYLLPELIVNDYVRLHSDNKPSCLWVKRTKLASITAEQWKKAETYLYYLSK